MSSNTQVAVALVSATIGYWVGVGSSLKYTNVTPKQSPAPSIKGEGSDNEESDEEEHDDTNLGEIKAGLMEECKLVGGLPWNDQGKDCCSMRPQPCDLGVLQSHICGESSVASSLGAIRAAQNCVEMRFGGGATVVTSNGTKPQPLCEIYSGCCSGRTQIAAGSRTVLGIGPVMSGPVSLINQVTGKLKLL
ncbi:PTH2 domain-containing protein [Rhizoctonia solani AG-1 IA]|uniref:peptidyl-tRNA hydrolase n=1 Tax=Thanatephorus cucumeris (strain AG1-IA) TaxID=983506 RepID=L8X724_THACA|nr:PTH2 domain-containing protein [Rhizoctonia solani AG-1 IA]